MHRVKFSSLLTWLAVLVLCPILGSVFFSTVRAQTPSPEQIDMFRNLSPEQQRAVMESMGIGGGTGTGAGTGRVRSAELVQRE